MLDREGQLIAGRYRLRGRLGSGGMGTVWRATDEFLEREVAIKEMTLLGEVGQSTPAFQRAIREARTSARLRHNNIVTVYDVVLENGLPWIVMELVDGPSLAGVVDRDGPLPENRARDVARQLLDALTYIHKQGILHRDVKPANVLLDGDRVVLTDFGIAAVDGGTALTATNQVIGSPQYLAPERINGQGHGPASDLWAVGVTLYSAITGASPFDRDTMQAVLAAVLTQDPPPVPGPLGPVVAGLLRKDPAERLTATEAGTLLDTGTEPTQDVQKPAQLTKPMPRPDRSKPPTGQVPVILALLVAIIGTFLWVALPERYASSLERMADRGSVVIGVRDDQPGLSRWDSVSQQFVGFDVEIATMVAAGLGYSEDKVTFKTVGPTDRENALAEGTVDMIVGAYPITEDNKQRVSFAGPYLLSGPRMLVREERTQLTTPYSLDGRICVAAGSRTAQELQNSNEVKASDLVPMQSLGECVDALIDKGVDGVASDDAQLTAFASIESDTLNVFAYSTTTVEYGIALAHDDKPTRDKINEVLTKALDDGTWRQIYDRTLGYSGDQPGIPTVRPY